MDGFGYDDFVGSTLDEFPADVDGKRMPEDVQYDPSGATEPLDDDLEDL